jgi:hypothetical protein
MERRLRSRHHLAMEQYPCMDAVSVKKSIHSKIALPKKLQSFERKRRAPRLALSVSALYDVHGKPTPART